MKYNIPVLEPDIGAREMALVDDAVRSGWVSSTGEYIGRFERNFADYCGRTFGISTSNGTHALHLALTGLGIGPGDEVIIPNLTFIASANAVTYTGAKPVMVEVDKFTWNIDPVLIEKYITKRTRAIMTVPLYGNPCDMGAIDIIAKKYNLFVVEDAAEAHGSVYQGRKCGSFGHISCFSFYGNKTITTGEGGMCLTDDKNLYEKMSLFKHHGMTPYKEYSKKYWHEVVGFNYRMTNMQAALGCAQLERIEQFITAKRRNNMLYRKNLRDVSSITFQEPAPDSESNYWLTSITIDASSGVSADELGSELKKVGIDTRNLFFALSLMPPYSKNASGLDISVDISQRGISLPSSSKLTESDIRNVCTEIKRILA